MLRIYNAIGCMDMSLLSLYWAKNAQCRLIYNIYNAMDYMDMSLLSLYWAFLWKAEFARILTSSRSWYILGWIGLWRFIAVQYHSIVCTRMNLVHIKSEPGLNLIQIHVEQGLCIWSATSESPSKPAPVPRSTLRLACNGADRQQ